MSSWLCTVASELLPFFPFRWLQARDDAVLEMVLQVKGCVAVADAQLALHWVLHSGHTATCQLLLDKGAANGGCA
jgi:hypothetical protein